MRVVQQNDLNSLSILCSYVADKTIVWLSDINKYIIVLPPVAEILVRLNKGETDNSILKYCKIQMNYSEDEASQLLLQVKNNLFNIQEKKKISLLEKTFTLEDSPENFDCKRFYKINKKVFCFEYENIILEFLIHPKLAYLEILQSSEHNHNFKVFQKNDHLGLVVNGIISGSWHKNNEHFMTGKVSMEILQKITATKEKDWMAVFHAAGISNGKDGILFLGDSGNGKSTLSAILMGNGFEVLADDFLPVENASLKLCSFPDAISVKKQAIDLLKEQFPELKEAREFVYAQLNKTVKYLSNPGSSDGKPKKVPCKALVFVKYEPNSGIKFSNLDKDVAFQKLVPDSWISPIEENAQKFLNWFDTLPCWQLTYSDNKAMLKTVQQLFNDEL